MGRTEEASFIGGKRACKRDWAFSNTKRDANATMRVFGGAIELLIFSFWVQKPIARCLALNFGSQSQLVLLFGHDLSAFGRSWGLTSLILNRIPITGQLYSQLLECLCQFNKQQANLQKKTNRVTLMNMFNNKTACTQKCTQGPSKEREKYGGPY